MTKKAYIALADALRETKPKSDKTRTGLARQEQWEQDVDAIVTFCRGQNPYFKEIRWRAYLSGECGPNGGKRNA